MITGHQFKPYTDIPHLCVAELANGDTCNQEEAQHARPGHHQQARAT